MPQARRNKLISLLEDKSNPDSALLLPLVMTILAEREPDPIAFLGDSLDEPKPIHLPNFREGDAPLLYIATQSVTIHVEPDSNSQMRVPIDVGTIIPVGGWSSNQGLV